jgi:hypothetical protein
MLEARYISGVNADSGAVLVEQAGAHESNASSNSAAFTGTDFAEVFILARISQTALP